MSQSAGRVLLLHKGNYDNSATYNPMDEVLYEGSTYVCKATTTGNAPTNTTYWQMMAQKGESGSSLPTGGTTGQVLTKASSTDYDAEWGDTFTIKDAQDAEVIESKNLAVFNPFVGTHNGVTFSVTNPQTCEYSIDGTATSVLQVALSDPEVDVDPFSSTTSGSISLKQGTYVLYCPQAVNVFSDSCHLSLMKADRTHYAQLDGTSTNVQFTISNSDGISGCYVMLTSATDTQFSDQKIQVMICTLDEWNASQDYVPYYAPLKDTAFHLADNRVLGAHNLYENIGVSGTINGITFTVNADGTVTATGESTEVSTWSAKIPHNLGGDFWFNGCPEGGGDSTNPKFDVRIVDLSAYDDLVTDYGNGSQLVHLNADHINVMIIDVNSSAGRYVDLTFKPMLRDLIDTDETYAPYAMTNRGLSEQVNDLASTKISGKKVSGTVSGSSVTFTDADLTSDSIIDGPYVGGMVMGIASVTPSTGSVTFTFTSADADTETAFIWIRG